MTKEKSISIIGCGWLGLPLAEYLIEQGFHVKGSTTRKEKLQLLESKGIEPFLFSACAKWKDSIDLSSLFQSEILYLNIPPGRHRPDVETAYPREIKNIVQLAIAGGTKKIIFISSTGVYPDANRTITEEHVLTSERPSGQALIMAEKYLQNLTKVKVTILRMAGLVGGERKAGRFLAGKQNVKNGMAPVNLVHRKDCIRVSYEIIRQGKWGVIYNVVADKHPERAKFYTQQALKEDLNPPTFVKPEETRFKIVSNEKVKKELGYEFLHPDPMEF